MVRTVGACYVSHMLEFIHRANKFILKQLKSFAALNLHPNRLGELLVTKFLHKSSRIGKRTNVYDLSLIDARLFSSNRDPTAMIRGNFVKLVINQIET